MKIRKCFFCEKYGLAKKENTYITDDYRRAFNKKYGYVNILTGKIGKKWICQHCCNDLCELIGGDIQCLVWD